MTRKLSDSLIATRMIEWQNLKVMHKHDRLQIKHIKTENKQLKQELVDQREYFESISQGHYSTHG